MLYQKAAHRTNVLAWVTVALGVALIAVEARKLRRAGVAHGGGTGGGRSAAGEVWYLAAGQAQPWREGIATAGYWPSIVEIIAIAGVAAQAGLIDRFWSKSVATAN